VTQNNTRVELLQRVAIAANEAITIEEAASTAIREICTHTGWPVGHLYLRTGRETFKPSTVWHLEDPERFGDFRALTDRTSITRGTGLIGRIAASGRPEWIPDVTADHDFLRGTLGDTRVRACLVFPLKSGAEVVGVLEFFSDEAVEPDSALLETMAHIGTQLGRVVERQRAEEALRLSEAKFAGVIELSADAILSVDEKHQIVLFNRGAEEIFGYRADEVLGQPLDLLLPQEARSAHGAHVSGFGADTAVAARRMGDRGQIYGRRKNGEIFPAEASISKLEIGGERIYSTVLRDMTEQRRFEAMLELQAEELRRSNAELERFASVASHDLQEPLRKIQAFGQRLEAKYASHLPEDGQDYLARMKNAAARMQALIQDLLTFSRLTTKAQPFEPVVLEAIVHDVISDLVVPLEQTGGHVEVGVLPTIEADALQLRQLFQNLVGNALKFHREGVPPVVRISAEVEDGLCRLLIEDNGIGFEEKYLDRIFEVFQRLHGRTEFEGTGMGLAICRKIAERHHGTITAQSAPGHGATFVITLPLAQSKQGDLP
jgi:PAS domain S-box-containing protein